MIRKKSDGKHCERGERGEEREGSNTYTPVSQTNFESAEIKFHISCVGMHDQIKRRYQGRLPLATSQGPKMFKQIGTIHV